MVLSNEKILRLPAVLIRTGLSRSTTYELIGRNQFPKPVSLGVRAVGWLESEVNEWIAKRISLSRTEQRV
jgi:prophage regulatory protein